MADINSKLTRQLGSYPNHQKAGKRNFNLVSWNDKDPKYDINVAGSCLRWGRA